MDWKVSASKWLVEVLDTKDFGWWSDKSRQIIQIPSSEIESVLQLSLRKQQLTQKLIRNHFDGSDEIHYRNRPASDRLLLRFESDAHHGEMDARSAIEFVDQFYCGGNLHIEQSGHGYGGYMVVDAGAMDPDDHYSVPSAAEINEAIAAISQSISEAAHAAGYQSKIEIQGMVNELDGSPKDPFGPFNSSGDLNEWTITVSRRVQTGRLPRFPGGESDFDEMRKRPVASLWSLLARCQEETAKPKASLKPVAVADFGDEPDAYKRMVIVRNKLGREIGRVPELDELLIRYEQARGTPSHDRRVARAKAALKWQAKHFDPGQATEGGYESNKSKRAAIVIGLMPSGCKWRKGTLTVEDAVIVLSAVEKSSFQVADKPDWQFTCGLKAIMAYAKGLKDAGLTDRGFSDKRKASATLNLLESIGLIQCLDKTYKHAGPIRGINRKWAIGTQHPRYREWVQFSETVGQPAQREHQTPAEAVNPLYVWVDLPNHLTLEEELGWGNEMCLEAFDEEEIVVLPRSRGRPVVMLSG